MKNKRLISGVLIIVLIIGVAFLVFSSRQNNKTPEGKTGQVPEFQVKDVLGLTAPFSFFYEKKPVILVFLDPGCPYCEKQIPILKKFHDKYKSEVYVVGVVSGRTKKDIKQYAMEKQIDFILSVDTSAEVMKKYDISSTPYLVVINKKGKIVGEKGGVVPFQKLKKLVRKFI